MEFIFQVIADLFLSDEIEDKNERVDNTSDTELTESVQSDEELKPVEANIFNLGEFH